MPASADFRLEVRGLTKRFGHFAALEDVTTEFRGGEAHALLGQNGAGKSTLVKILAGIYSADGGSVHVDGEEVRIRSPRDAQALGLGFVHQDLALTLDQSVEENLFLGVRAPRARALAPLGIVSRRAAGAEARPLLERVGLAHVDPRSAIADLPVAERCLVAIARGLAREERMLVLDEPTVSLSDREVGRLFEVIERIKADGVAVVYISHRMEEIERLADRITVLKDGRVVGRMAAGEVGRQQLVELMAGSEPAVRNDTRKPTGERLLSVRGLAGEGGVRDVSFDLQRGEILGLAGLVGSRRTETVSLIAGLGALDSGTLELDGKPYAPRNAGAALQAGVVLVAEDRADSLLVGQSVAENISVASLRRFRPVAQLPFVSAGRERATAREMIERLGIRTRDERTPVEDLSGGNQQKVVLARWLTHGAEVFIFDEPTRGIDVHGKHQIYEIMVELAGQGAGVIFISSELPELLEVADRLVVMREGRSVATLPAGSSEHDVLSWCYGDATDQTLTEVP